MKVLIIKNIGMKILLKILKIFFVFLGVIFFIIIIGFSYLWIADPFDIKKFISSEDSFLSVAKNISSGNNNWKIMADIDAVDLPSEISPEMERCFIQKLGEQRVEEIKTGSEINANDYLKANSCFKAE